MDTNKAIQSLVLDAGAILKNEPPVDTILSHSELLYRVPSVVSEITDSTTRTGLDNLLRPFLRLQFPRTQSLQLVIEFAKQSGDYSVLSRADLEILALTYELDIQCKGGNEHLRQFPGQKPPHSQQKTQLKNSKKDSTSKFNAVESESTTGGVVVTHSAKSQASSTPSQALQNEDGSQVKDVHGQPVEASHVILDVQYQESSQPEISSNHEGQVYRNLHDLLDDLDNLQIESPSNREFSERKDTAEHVAQQSTQDTNDPSQSNEHDPESDDSEGWITPSNLQKHQMRDLNGPTAPISEESQFHVSCITTDFAMQNVLLQIGLNLLSPSLQRIRNIRTYILRCHACFQQVKDTSKQFCPRCGGATLTRVSCSTDAKGVFRIHLKKNMQWNHRGDRYSIPKPVSGSASGKVTQGKAGGKGGWGQGLILAEDQKEYQRAVNGGGKSMKAKDFMDEDYLPGSLTGDRSRPGGRPKVGAGRNVNAKKRAR